MSPTHEIVNTFVALKEIQEPNYGKLLAEAKFVRQAYELRGQGLDDILQDMCKLEAEAKSYNFNWTISTLNKYLFRS